MAAVLGLPHNLVKRLGCDLAGKARKWGARWTGLRCAVRWVAGASNLTLRSSEPLVRNAEQCPPGGEH